MQHGGIGANSHIQVAKLRRLPEKLHMPALQQVITPGYKYFLWHVLILVVNCIGIPNNSSTFESEYRVVP